LKEEGEWHQLTSLLNISASIKQVTQPETPLLNLLFIKNQKELAYKFNKKHGGPCSSSGRHEGIKSPLLGQLKGGRGGRGEKRKEGPSCEGPYSS